MSYRNDSLVSGYRSGHIDCVLAVMNKEKRFPLDPNMPAEKPTKTPIPSTEPLKNAPTPERAAKEHKAQERRAEKGR